MQIQVTQDALVAAAVVILGSPVLMASVRFLFFVGRASKTLDHLEKTFEKGVADLKKIMEDHETRISTIEIERRTEKRLGRRATDALLMEVTGEHEAENNKDARTD